MLSQPTISLHKLYALRNRERLFGVLWGACRWISSVLVLFALAVFIDWQWDKSRDTPFWARVFMTSVQVSFAVIAAYYWLLRPWGNAPQLDNLAHRVEKRIPDFDHRLVTALQLTRKTARTEGMSTQLIAEVTGEAESMVRNHDLTRLADHRRLKWSIGLLMVPILVSLFLVIKFGPTLLTTLAQRQALMNADIPRKVHLENVTHWPSTSTNYDQVDETHWPAGDEVILRFVVKGLDSEEEVGKVRVAPRGQPVDEYDLKFESHLDDNRWLFTAKVPHSSTPFDFRARLGDGRTHHDSRVVFEPRPIVTIAPAWVHLPDYAPRDPENKPYEMLQPQGDLHGFPGSGAKVRIYTQKPVVSADLVLFQRDKDGENELERRKMDLQPEESGVEGEKRYPAEASFKMVPGQIAYRVVARDSFGFDNFESPRRSIDFLPEDPPQVILFPERYALPGETKFDEQVMDGMPLPINQPVPIVYSCSSQIGFRFERDKQGRPVTPAFLAYRVIPAGVEADKVKDIPWKHYPLVEVPETPETGPYDVAQASFTNKKYQKEVLKDRVEFHAKQYPDADIVPPRWSGGGRLSLETGAFVRPDGGKVQLGDSIEFCIEVYDRIPTPGRAPGRSEIRRKEVVTDQVFFERLMQTLDTEQKINELERKQRGVFGPSGGMKDR